MKTNSFKDLLVWQRSIELVEAAYSITHKLPKTETYALASQMQRASVSIPSNIAEGYGRNNRKEYIQFLGIAFASSAELETQLILVKKLYPSIVIAQVENLLIEVQKMLSAMIKKLR